MQPEPRPFRAGDHVLHKPSGETWVLACDEERGEVICCGWPESFAKAAECELVKEASDDARRKLLLDVARSCREQLRGRRAQRQLALGANPPCTICIACQREHVSPASRRSGEATWCREHYAGELEQQRKSVASTQRSLEAVQAAEELEISEAPHAPA